MRAYKFLDEKYGLLSLEQKRLKISRLEELNDPFELIPYNLTSKKNRWAVHQTRATLGMNRGMLCFSETWQDPVLWAHYGDKHRGICIGFEIPAEAKIAERVKYVSRRLPFPKLPTQADIKVMLFTKFKNWKYEREIRIFTTLEDADSGLYFREFDDILRPVAVIAGARCTVTKERLKQVLGSLAREVELKKARPGFKRFEIVQNQSGFRD